jgi:hypothetical protein
MADITQHDTESLLHIVTPRIDMVEALVRNR